MANDGPRAGEIFRLGTDGSSSATYAPALDPGLPPTVAQAPATGFFFANESWGAGYTNEGASIQVFGGLFGLGAYLLNASDFSVTGQYNFGSTGTPFDLEVAPDGTILTRQTTSGGSIARFRQTGIQNFLTGETGTQLVEQFGFGQQGTGVGMAESEQGYIYVTDAANARLNVFAPATAPDAEMEETGFVDLTTAELRATVNAQDLNITNCEFQWGTTVAYSNPAVPCDVTPTGSQDMQVTAQVNVTARTTYQSRIILSADNGTATYSANFEWQAPDLPEADTLAAGPQQRKGTAVLGGAVDPNQTPTGYYIEYSTDPALAGTQRYPAQNVPVANGDSPERVFQTVPGLASDTTYYFRVVAETKAGADAGSIESFRTFTEPTQPPPTECSNDQYRTGQSALLPDCRAWEQVSPADKAGGSVAQGQVIRSTDGNRVTFGAATAFAGAEGLGVTGMYMSERSSQGWSTASMSPAISAPTSLIANNWLYSGFTSDLSQAAGSFSNVDIEGQQEPLQNKTAYLWDSEQRKISSIYVASGSSNIASVDLSASGNRALLFGNDLSVEAGPASPSGKPSLYWWSEQAGLSVASIMPNGDPVDPTGQLNGRMARNGERVLWTAAGPQGRPGSRELYMSEEGQPTVWVSEAQGISQPAVTSANIVAQTPDLRYVYFTSAQVLTADSTGQGSKLDLYRFDSETGDLVDLTTTDPAGADVVTVMHLSDDGSHVYFLARGNLAPGATGSDIKLYAWHDGQIRFITNYNGYQANAGLGFTGGVYERMNRVSADGRYFLFAHLGSPVGTRMDSVYETAGNRMFYRYDYDEDRIDCVNCHPMGKPATSDGYLTTPVRYRPGEAATIGIGPERYFMSDEGEVMFITEQSLVPGDVNRHADTYLWDGDTRLLTSGKGAHPQWAQAATDGFERIFVISPSQLVPSDLDHETDLYVASVGGGLPGQQVRPIASDEGCRGESCQGLGSQEPELPRLSSESGGDGKSEPAAVCQAQRRILLRSARGTRASRVALRKARQRAVVGKRLAGRQKSRAARRAAVKSRKVLRRSKVRAKRAVVQQRRARSAFIRCRGGAR